MTEPLPSDGLQRAEQNPKQWLDAMLESSTAALDAADEKLGGNGAARAAMRGMGVSGQQHGMVVLDGEFRVLRPAKLWCDTESAPEAEYLASLDPERQGHIVAGYTSTKLLWLKRNEPETFAKVRHLALPHDYLNWALTGTLVMEGGDASGTGLLDNQQRAWDAAAAAAVDEDLLDKLPPLIGPADFVGEGSGGGEAGLSRGLARERRRRGQHVSALAAAAVVDGGR